MKPLHAHPHPHPGQHFNRLRLLGLNRLGSEHRAAASCVMVQIDGLSYRNFRKALQTGKLPFLTRLLRRQDAVAGPWHSMLPTSTSAFQTGLFYGDNDDIPGFFWYDKKLRRKIRMNGAEDTARLEDEIQARCAPFPGLLAGGSSYSALFTGGAANTFLTFARLFSPRYNLTARRGWIWLFFLSQFLLLGRIVYYSAIEFCLALYDVTRALFTGRNRAAEFKFIFPRIMSSVVCREIATLATILDISRGVGPIYLNYFAYDEHAHLRGPDSRFAFWTLRGIDASIRRIWKAAVKARRAGVRHYDVFVWSDHGQTPSISFQELFQETPEHHFEMLFRAIYDEASYLKAKHASEFMAIRPGGRQVRPPRQAKPAGAYREMGPRWAQFLVSPPPRPAHAAGARPEPARPADPQHRLVFVSTGPVAHLCVDDGGAPLAWEDWHERYPFFLDLIAQHRGIGFTLVRTREGGCRVGYDGEWLDLMDPAGLRSRVPLGLAQILVSRREELRRWANMPRSGDLLIFGQREPDRPAITYSCECGSHAGPSPHETLPFILVPRVVAMDWPEVSMEKAQRLLTLQDLHERLRRAYFRPREPLGIEKVLL